MAPRATLDPFLPILPRPLVVHIPATLGLTGLAVAYLDALAGPVRDLTEPQAAMVADNLARLIAMACGGASQPHGGLRRRSAPSTPTGRPADVRYLFLT